MYLKLPTYINYQNVAICPNGKLETFCSILDKKETINLQWEGNFTYVPFEAGHSYIMFCGNEFTEQVTYFQTDKAMFNFLKKLSEQILESFMFMNMKLQRLGFHIEHHWSTTTR